MAISEVEFCKAKERYLSYLFSLNQEPSFEEGKGSYRITLVVLGLLGAILVTVGGRYLLSFPCPGIFSVLVGAFCLALPICEVIGKIRQCQIRKALKANDLNKALEIYMSCGGKRQCTFELICQKIVEQGKIDAAFEMIERYSDPGFDRFSDGSGVVSIVVFMKALEQGKIDVALQVCNSRSYVNRFQFISEQARREVVYWADKLNKVDKVYHLILENDRYVEYYRKGIVNSYVAKKAAADGNFKGALRVCSRLDSNKDHFNPTLSYIVRKMVVYPWENPILKLAALNRALTLVPKITDEEERNKVLFFIAFRATVDQNDPLAVKAREMITPGWIEKHPNLRNILFRMVEADKFPTAFFLASQLRIPFTNYVKQ